VSAEKAEDAASKLQRCVSPWVNSPFATLGKATPRVSFVLITGHITAQALEHLLPTMKEAQGTHFNIIYIYKVALQCSGALLNYK